MSYKTSTYINYVLVRFLFSSFSLLHTPIWYILTSPSKTYPDGGVGMLQMGVSYIRFINIKTEDGFLIDKRSMVNLHIYL